MSNFKDDDKKIQVSCEIYNKVFSKNMNTEVFYYKHYENPYKVLTPILNDEIDGKIAGINCFMGAKFIAGHKEVFGAQSCDSAVLPEFRGKGVFSRIIRAAEEQCEVYGIDFLFGFPNEKSYPGFMKLGWVHVGDFYRAVLPLDTCKFFERKFKKNIPSSIGKISDLFIQKKLNNYSKKSHSINIQENQECPFTEEDFEVINRTEGIMVKRSYQYYRWKVDNNPSRSFKYIIARDGDRLVGFVIYEILEDNSIDIVDWLCFESDNENQKIVLSKIFNKLKGKGTSISISLVNGCNNEMNILESIGFLNASNRIMKQRPLPLVVKVFGSESEKQLLEVKAWKCRFLDTDVIIS